MGAGNLDPAKAFPMASLAGFSDLRHTPNNTHTHGVEEAAYVIHSSSELGVLLQDHTRARSLKNSQSIRVLLANLWIMNHLYL
ncbi:hypothetical protein AB1N83_000874 [Pleurotus pulmonarius]